jgi:hypothetical protein
MRITSAQYPVDEYMDGCADILIRSRVRHGPGLVVVRDESRLTRPEDARYGRVFTGPR